MSECSDNKLLERWILVAMVLAVSAVMSIRVENHDMVFTAWMELLGIGFGWYFRDKIST